MANDHSLHPASQPHQAHQATDEQNATAAKTPPSHVHPGAHPFSPLAKAPATSRALGLPAPNVPAEPRPGDAMVRLTIDGQEVVARKGTNLLEAAKLVGKDICHFCYHPGLTIAASCRQCLVEIEKQPKLTPSCQQVVADGMVVYTESPRVLEARQAMLEFTLVNHPIDCPICDKAGECILQRHYMDHDHTLTRVDVPKIRKAKHKDIGEHIVLDAERCILCSRCVRFCEEVPKTNELCMTWRGDHEELDVAEGLRLDNPYSMNVVDICPVGALTSKDFRFQVRAWELKATETTCPGCATGCAVELHSKNETPYRLIPRNDPDVNGFWMCDDGRFTYKDLDPSARVRQAVIDGQLVALDQAIEVVAERLRGKKTAVVFSAAATNEANLALSDLADALRAARFLVAHPHGESDDILRDADKNPNTVGARRAAGDDLRRLDELALELAGRAYEAVVFLDGIGRFSDIALNALGGMTSVCLADRQSPLADACTMRLPACSWAEVLGTFYNRQGRLRVVRPAWRPEGDRQHRADLLRRILLALDANASVPTARDRTTALAEKDRHSELLQLVRDPVAMRPKLLRWGHSRG